MKWHVASLGAYLRCPFRYMAILNSRDDNMNRVLAKVASRLPEVTFLTMMVTSSNRFEEDSSKHHTNAIPVRVTPRQSRPGLDLLFLLDSDMHLTEPTNVTTGVLRNRAHVASVLKSATRFRIFGHNFCVLRLPHRDDYAQPDFAPAMWLNHQDGSLHSLDSWGSTAIFLNQNHHLRILIIIIFVVLVLISSPAVIRREQHATASPMPHRRDFVGGTRGRGGETTYLRDNQHHRHQQQSVSGSFLSFGKCLQLERMS